MTSTTTTTRFLLCVGAALSFLPHHAEGQAPRVAVVASTVSADTVEIGDVFVLEVTLRVAEGSTAFLPDSIVSGGFEPFAPVEWSAEAEEAGTTLIRARYALIAFDVGDILIPDFEVYAASSRESRVAGAAVDDGTVGEYEVFVERVASIPTARLASVAPHRVHVGSVIVLDEAAGTIAPRPPADVWGGNRDWLTTLLAVGFGIVLISVGSQVAREWRTTQELAAVQVDPRDEALAALDSLASTAPHREGRVRDFFEASSSIVRRYVESFDARWSPARTATELMESLSEAERPRQAATAELQREMVVAEEVKFAGTNPTLEDADSHLEELRRWITSDGDADS